MDIISLYKHRIDALMDILFGAGVSNPQTIIEQLNYLLFLRALSIKDDEAELLGITDESEKIFSGDLAKYRWQNLLALNAEDLFKTLETSFDLLQKKSKNPTVKLLFRNAHIKIFDKPTLRRVLHEIETFSKELDAIAHEGNKDVFGDMYEYLLSKLSSAGTNGQFRTPRHIIDFMVKVVDPKKNETILDPACGTAGFLVAAYRYIAGEYTSDKLKKAGSPRAMDKLSADEKNFLFNHMFTGFDSDEDMIKFGMMNLHLHGLTKSRLARQNSLTDTSGMKDKFDVILANPPFSGKIDEESVTEDLRMGTKATELLFLRFMMDHLSLKGKLAVIVPEGVVFNASKAHTKIRQMLIEKGLWAVVSLPSGVFNPYAGVKTNILFLDAEVGKKKDELLFVRIENDGRDLGAQRRPIEKDDLPLAIETINAWKAGKKIENKLTVYVSKQGILNNPDLSLSVDRYRAVIDHSNAKWAMFDLGDICTFEYGEAMPEKNRKTGPFPVVGSNGIVGFHEVALIKGPSIIVGRKGSAGEVTWINEDSFPIDTTYFVKLKKDDADLRYLYYILTSIGLPKLRAGGGVPGLNRKDAYVIKVPVPPLEVQKQIAVELNSYQNVINGSKQVIENWRPQISIDSEWDKMKLGDVCDFVRGPFGGSLKKEIFVKNGLVVYEQSHAIYEDFSKFRYRITKEKFEEMKRFEVKPHDLIMSCSGTMGKTAIVPVGAEKGIINQALLKLTPHPNLNVRFLKLWMDSNDFQIQLLSHVAGAAIQNVASVKVLQDLDISLPPLEVQNKIVNQIEEEQKMIDTSKQLVSVFEQKIKDRLAKLWSA